MLAKCIHVIFNSHETKFFVIFSTHNGTDSRIIDDHGLENMSNRRNSVGEARRKIHME
jgi:tRNA(Ile2) C34 agmatinyltransferase TiaS